MIGDGCGASDWARGKNLLCCLAEACSRHGKASCLTWSNLLPHMEQLITSRGKTCCLTISQAQNPSPRLFILQLGHGNILHLTGIPRGLSSSADYPPTKIVDAATMKIEEDVAQMGQFFQCRGGAYRLVCAV